MAAVDDQLLDALNTTTSWSVDSATAFTLRGAHTVRLRLDSAAPAASPTAAAADRVREAAAAIASSDNGARAAPR